MKVINLVLIILLVLLIIFLLSRYLFITDIIYDILCNADEQANTTANVNDLSKYFSGNKNIIYNDEINENSTSNFMLSVWFYIDNWGDNISMNKNVLYIATNKDTYAIQEFEDTSILGLSQKFEQPTGSTDLYKNLHISLDKYNNTLFIDIETYNDNPTNDEKYIFTRYVVKNISIQKWNCLTLSVDGKTLDVYLDGKLRNSFVLNGIYRGDVSSGDEKNIYLGQIGDILKKNASNDPNVGFQGYITRIRYQTNGITPKEAYDIYKKGINASHSKSFYNKYGLKVSFMEYNDEKGSFTI
tara:strand:- start:5003 stop:5899 length:897 start_codon:yes stop_codon:yes gene_type:complete